MVVTKFCRPRLLIKPEKDQIREMMIASAKNYTYTISLADGNLDMELEPETAVAPPRKRRRLDYLSPEEKARRKKLKNREAAQTSRDKKKAYVTRLEETIKALRDENQRLAYQMMEITEQKDELARTNASLREELKAATSDRSGPLARPAAPAEIPPQKERRPLPSNVLSLTLPLTLLTLMWTWKISNGSTNSPSRQSISKSSAGWPILCRKRDIKLRSRKKPRPPLSWWGPSQKAWNPIGRSSSENPLLTM